MSEAYTPAGEKISEWRKRSKRRGPRETKKAGSRSCPPGKEVPRRRQGLFKFFGHYWERELGFGQGLYDGGLGVFRRGVAGRSHLADQQVLRAFEHFLFAEGERFAAAEGDQTLEDDGDFEEGTGTHSFGIFLEAVFPVVVRVELAFFEEAKDFACVGGADDGTKTNRRRVRLRDHNPQTADNNADHVIPFGSTVQHPVTDLFDYSNAVVRINDFVANLIVHSFGSPP